MSDERHDVIVIGGGQAGLAIGQLHARRGRQLTILDAADAAAAAWRARWDSLKLFTPVRYRAPSDVAPGPVLADAPAIIAPSASGERSRAVLGSRSVRGTS